MNQNQQPRHMSRSLTLAVLNQAIGYLREGNMRRARALGFSDDELRELRRLSATDIEALSCDGPAVCRLTVDHEMLLIVMQRLIEDQDRETRIDRCLTLGASVTMMSTFFGLTGNDCATRRSLLGLPSRQGRLAMPEEAVEHDAWHRWQSICETPDQPRATEDLHGMMTLAEETQIPLAVIWHLVKAWAEPNAPRGELEEEEADGPFDSGRPACAG
ncbi:DUF2857 domain-containing protein [Halomonas elongata]|uniref:DUF2857 domain protein n=1 Tax=Halomonas elongata (strain ATCC 33173 / DSM 2581 / NBRC 15536 / NCIMB 2198 / 1H9) TaxID=768066 RepID=E1VA28_HALED|nr:DUF2857 domain-containing protein [Halomonas elongata]WBF17654.1 DUF2857 domain-containing protein [Halomonas elongata]WPU46493.1 DUF2857 domain-containing protein [Halomonas elongata DSM 2581]CBV43916.1 DUF2857 domain protein [Halomonas elongata DSM 2581]